MFFRNLSKQGPTIVQPVQEYIPTPQDKIRAFNSIVSILAQIQQGEPFKYDEIPSANPPDRSEQLQLKLSNAFAHLAVADTSEVVAATLYTPEELAVVTWMQDEDPNDKLPRTHRKHRCGRRSAGCLPPIRRLVISNPEAATRVHALSEQLHLQTIQRPVIQRRTCWSTLGDFRRTGECRGTTFSRCIINKQVTGRRQRRAPTFGF